MTTLLDHTFIKLYLQPHTIFNTKYSFRWKWKLQVFVGNNMPINSWYVIIKQRMFYGIWNHECLYLGILSVQGSYFIQQDLIMSYFDRNWFWQSIYHLSNFCQKQSSWILVCDIKATCRSKYLFTFLIISNCILSS